MLNIKIIVQQLLVLMFITFVEHKESVPTHVAEQELVEIQPAIVGMDLVEMIAQLFYENHQINIIILTLFSILKTKYYKNIFYKSI